MPDELMPDEGPFLSFLTWLGRGGDAVRHGLRGNYGAAGRQVADFFGEIPDAFLPGDIIPNLTTKEDFLSPSEFVGMDEDAPWWQRLPTDIGLGILTDPISLVPGAAVLKGIGAGTQAVKAGANALRAASPVADNALGVVERGMTDARRALNWLDLTDEQRNTLDALSATGANTSRAGLAEVERLFKGTGIDEQEAIGEIMLGIARNGDDRSAWSRIGYGPDELGPDLPLDLRAAEYLKANPALDAGKITSAVAGLSDLGRVQAADGLAGGIFNDSGDLFSSPYFQRQFSGVKQADITEDALGQPSAVKGRAIPTTADALSFLRAEPGVDLEFNALTAAASRAGQQGRMAQKAAIGQHVVGEGFKLANPEDATNAKAAIEAIEKADPDMGYRLRQMWDGMPTEEAMPGGFALQILKGTNRVFKSAATYGILIPRVSFTVRNELSSLWQVLSSDKTRATFPQALSRTLSNLIGAFDDGVAKVGGFRFTGNELTQRLAKIDEAFESSGGSARKALETLDATDKDLADAMRTGVLNNFISAEELTKRIAKTPAGRKFQDWMDMPAEIGQGLEQRLRLGTFLDLRKRRVDPAMAARGVKEAFLDYDVVGTANRTFRQAVPFGAWISQNLPQQAKFLASKPAVAVGVGELFGQEDEGLPKYDWIAQQPSLPFGLDEEQNPQYLTSLGVPVEGLADVPGWSQRGLEQNVVGNLHPLLKSIYSAFSDRDPFTGGDAFSYDREPITGEQSDLGRKYRTLASTGLIQPLATPIGMLDTLFDDRKDAGSKALQLLTGARIASVDPDRAEREAVERYLDENPDVREFRTFYQSGEDEGVRDAIQRLRDANKRLREKRERAKAGSII
jgi:hypothetical protein